MKILKKFSGWALQWRIDFGPDAIKQAQEVIFSRKINKNIHPLLFFNNAIVSHTNSKKHLEVTLN